MLAAIKEATCGLDERSEDRKVEGRDEATEP
jgi:hypothetical protein